MPLSLAAAHLAATGGLKGKLKEAIATLMRNFEGWRAMLEKDGHVVTVATMLDESGYMDMWKQRNCLYNMGLIWNEEMTKVGGCAGFVIWWVSMSCMQGDDPFTLRLSTGTKTRQPCCWKVVCYPLWHAKKNKS